MIIFDTETTDLLKPELADITAQPHIVEIALLKLDDKTYKEQDRYEALIKPPVPLDEVAHKTITKLTNAQLADCPTFVELAGELKDFFLGQRRLIAHNMAFDLGMLTCELRRIGMEYAFPYPPDQLCTVVATKHLQGHRLKLVDLYERVMKKKLKQDHRAMSDAVALAEIVRKMKL